MAGNAKFTGSRSSRRSSFRVGDGSGAAGHVERAGAGFDSDGVRRLP